MLENQTFHPKLIISEHFDEIKNQIDIQTETLLCDKNLCEADYKILNDLRHRQLETLEQVQPKIY